MAVDRDRTGGTTSTVARTPSAAASDAPSLPATRTGRRVRLDLGTTAGVMPADTDDGVDG